MPFCLVKLYPIEKYDEDSNFYRYEPAPIPPDGTLVHDIPTETDFCGAYDFAGYHHITWYPTKLQAHLAREEAKVREEFAEQDITLIIAWTDRENPPQGTLPTYVVINSLSSEDISQLTAHEEAKKSMVSLSFKKVKGHIYIVVDAQELHTILDAMGAQKGTTQYKDRPQTDFTVVNTVNNTLSTEIFLYLPTKAEDGTVTLPEFDLTSAYNRPVALASLETLGQSAETAVRTILDHYQPVDIKVDLRKKVV